MDPCYIYMHTHTMHVCACVHCVCVCVPDDRAHQLLIGYIVIFIIYSECTFCGCGAMRTAAAVQKSMRKEHKRFTSYVMRFALFHKRDAVEPMLCLPAIALVSSFYFHFFFFIYLFPIKIWVSIYFAFKVCTAQHTHTTPSHHIHNKYGVQYAF